MNNKFLILITALVLALGSSSSYALDWSLFENYKDIDIYKYTAPDTVTPLTIDTSTLILAGKMKSDCSDVRFTDSLDNNIPYWLYDCNTANTKFWIKTNTQITKDGQIKIHYGNTNAISQESIPNVFGSSAVAFYDLSSSANDLWGVNNGIRKNGQTGTVFDGVDDYVEVPIGSLKYNNPLTMITKSSTTSTTAGQVIAGKLSSNFGHVYYGLEFLDGASYAGQTYFRTYESTPLHKSIIGTLNGLNDGSNRYISFTKSSNTVNIYVDGTQEGTLTYDGTMYDNTEQPFTIGAWKYGTTISDYFNGNIDYIMLFSRVLSSEEVKALSHDNPYNLGTETVGTIFTYQNTLQLTDSTDYLNKEFPLQIDTNSLTNIQIDCDDLVFTNSQNVTLKHYTDISTCKTTNTKIYINIDNQANTDGIIRMFYGNQILSSTSDKTFFTFFDDFNDNVLDGWTQTFPPYNYNSPINVLNGKIYGSSSGWNGIRQCPFLGNPLNGDYILEGTYEVNNIGNYNHMYLQLYDNSNNNPYLGIYELEASGELYSLPVVTPSITNLVSGNTYPFIAWSKDSNTYVKINGITDTSIKTGTQFDCILIGLYNSNNKLDNIILRHNIPDNNYLLGNEKTVVNQFPVISVTNNLDNQIFTIDIGEIINLTSNITVTDTESKILSVTIFQDGTPIYYNNSFVNATTYEYLFSTNIAGVYTVLINATDAVNATTSFDMTYEIKHPIIQQGVNIGNIGILLSNVGLGLGSLLNNIVFPLGIFIIILSLGFSLKMFFKKFSDKIGGNVE